MFSKGLRIFLRGFGNIAQHPFYALKLVLPWILICDLVLLWEWRSQGEEGQLSLLLMMLMVPCIALPWHRQVLPDHISQPSTRPDAIAFGFYLIEWLVITAFCLALIALLVFLFALLSLDLFDRFYVLIVLGEIVPALGLLAVSLPLFCCISYVIHRISYVLPYWALRRQRLGWRAAWRQTAPISRAIWVPAILIVLMAFVTNHLFLYVETPHLTDHFANDDGRAIAGFLMLLLPAGEAALGALVGASVLTEIYRETQEASAANSA